MMTFDSGAAAPPSDLPAPGFIARTRFNTSHKGIALRYLWLAVASVVFEMLLSVLMRIHLVWPSAHIPFLSNFAATPARYAALTLLHGSLMVFLLLTTASQAGFGNYFLPFQIGAREVAFPLLNLILFWITAVSFLGITASFVISHRAGLTLWTASVSLFCLAALLTSINIAVTEPLVHRGAYEFFHPADGEDFTPQWVEHVPAEPAQRAHASSSPNSREPQLHLNEQRAK